MDTINKKIVIAVTGASGSIYAIKTIEALKNIYDKIYLIVSDNAYTVAENELGYKRDDFIEYLTSLNKNIEIHRVDDISAAPASGSIITDGMIVVPCSVGTLGRIASGISNDLITRSADVCLKERRKLVLVVRETPLNLIHLRNMTVLTEAGAIILPASPAFYNKPETIDDLTLYITSRIMQQFNIKDLPFIEWGYPKE